MTDQEKNTNEYVRYRLSEWGEWSRSLKGVQLGYPSQAAHMAEHVDGGRVGLSIDENERAESVEQIMCKLMQVRPSLHKALVQWYIVQASTVEGSRACGCGERIFRDRVRQGEMFVAGRILG